MTPPETLLSLTERVEAASGADRRLDVEIAAAVDWRWDGWEEGDLLISAAVAKHGLEWALERASSGASIWRNLPRFTASLDAAMSLAKDFGGGLTFFKDGTAKVYLWQPYPMAVEAKAATPALALTAAALRAHASQSQEPSK